VIPGPPAVAVQDGFRNTVTSSAASITIAIGTNPTGATLSGTMTRPATAGVVSFDDLTVSQPGAGYTLTASSPGLTAATSAAFAIMATTGNISGRVTRASDRTPLSGAVVDALQAGLVKGSMTTDIEGSYAIRGLAPGSYDVRASASGYQAQTQDALTITAGNTASVDFSLSAVPGPNIRITSPAAGSIIDRLTVVVRGEISAPAGMDVGVSVNDIPGFVDGGEFVALVSVDPTVTALTATASSAGGALAADSIPITVQASAADPLFNLRATPAGGLAPLTVGFDLSAEVGISQIALDVDGDGAPDVQGATLTGVSFTLSEPGIYLPQATVTDFRGVVQTATTIVQVLDRALLDQRLQAVWRNVKDALRVGAVTQAVGFIHSDTREQYRAQFDQFPPATLGAVDQIMTTIQLVEVGFAGAQYEMLRQQDGQVFSYAVWFQLDQDGLWRLRRF
jgi:carboxypeptidase family protein